VIEGGPHGIPWTHAVRHPRGLACQAACWFCWRWAQAVSSS
jgi:wyosine [tRNA(Phe)-imidazoG37] synthetase (radical SAM superfamily)